MSTVMIVAPIVIANWGTISAAVAAGIAAAGFTATAHAAAVAGQARSESRGEVISREEIDVPDSEILEGTVGIGEQVVAERDGIRAIFTRDARGGLKVCVEGAGITAHELRRVGEELIGRVTQQYVYHRLVSELEARNVQIVHEEVTADQAVKIRVRSW